MASEVQSPKKRKAEELKVEPKVDEPMLLFSIIPTDEGLDLGDRGARLVVVPLSLLTEEELKWVEHFEQSDQHVAGQENDYEDDEDEAGFNAKCNTFLFKFHSKVVRDGRGKRVNISELATIKIAKAIEMINAYGQ